MFPEQKPPLHQPARYSPINKKIFHHQQKWKKETMENEGKRCLPLLFVL